MNKPMIDIIVTHHDEPWDVGRKFFLMLSMQRNVDLSKFRVILVQDGEQGALEWDDIFASCPYEVIVVTAEKSGVSGARNIGIQNAQADWVMFCDFDDTFSDVYSMSMMLNVLPMDEADILWMNCYHEEKQRSKENFVHLTEENFLYTYGKLYRLSFLNDRNIRFCKWLKYDYEYAFNTLALSEVAPNRTLKIVTKFNTYVKTYRPEGYNMRRDTLPDRMEYIFQASMYLVDEFRRRNNQHELKMAVTGAIYNAYYLLNSTPRVPHYHDMLTQFKEFYQNYQGVFQDTKAVDKEVVMQNTTNRMIMIVQQLYTTYNVEAQTPPDGEHNVDKWLRSFRYTSSAPITDPSPVILPAGQPAPHPARFSGKAVVYCGTKNTYPNIYASVKSLLANTHVDRIYILIEDDEFPYDLPDFAIVINVSGQQFFPHDGPNYKNVWSYMCMMRAAFPKLFPDLDRVLSLDIDVVVTKDISELWDLDLSHSYYAGVHEPDRPSPDYCNFGVIMMNLDLMRRDGIDDRIIALLNTSKQQCPEQDAFHKVCTGRIKTISSKYNYTPFSHITEDTQDESIVHYAGITYWKNFSIVRKYADMDIHDILSGKHAPEHDPTPVFVPASPRIAVYCGTRNVYNMMESAAKSLIFHTRVDKVYFLIEDDTFPHELPDIIECVNVSQQIFFPHDGPNYDTSWTYMVLMRAALPLMFPRYDRILSLDNDTIVTGDISALWDTDLSSSYFAAVCEDRVGKRMYDYYNFGVVLHNLSMLRDSGMTNRVINALNSKRYPYNEQDCMNEFCAGSITELPPEYNSFCTLQKADKHLIMHYAGPFAIKYHFKNAIKEYTDMPWNDVIRHYQML